jgi:hypothetical protein
MRERRCGIKTRPQSIIVLSMLIAACDFPRPADVGDARGNDDTGPAANACCVTPDECSRIGSNAPKPCSLGVCVHNECTTANASCDGDEDCSGDTRFCVAETCSVCRTSATCPVSSPVCDETSHSCRACAKDQECDSGACDLAVGACVDPGAILYASPAGTSADACTRLAPCSLSHAASLVDTAHQYIVLLPGIHTSGASFNSKSAIIVGDAATIDLTSSDIEVFNSSPGIVAVRFRNFSVVATNQFLGIFGTRNAINCGLKTELTIDNIDMTIGTGGGGAGITAIGSQGTVTIRNSTISHGNVSVSGELLIDRSTFLDASLLISSSGTPIEISNSIFVAGPNGLGIFITQNAADNLNGGLILNNTIIGSQIGCSGATSKHFESNIFYNSTFFIDSDKINCNYDYNLIFPSFDLGGTGNKTGDPSFADLAGNDYHLRLGSPAIGTANPNRAPPFGHDRDGVDRPQGAGVDVGAFEYVSSVR